MVSRAKIVGVFLLALLAGLIAGIVSGSMLLIMLLPLAHAMPSDSGAADVVLGLAAFVGLIVTIVVTTVIDGAWDFEHGIDV